MNRLMFISGADEADLLHKIMKNPSMMKLMTHPKTVEAMEEIASEIQSAPQQTEGNDLFDPIAMSSLIKILLRAHLSSSVVPFDSSANLGRCWLKRHRGNIKGQDLSLHLPIAFF